MTINARLIAGILGGLVLGIVAAFVANVAIGRMSTLSAIGFIAFSIAGLVIAWRSPSASKCWRRIFFTAAGLSFLLPFLGVTVTASLSSYPRFADPSAADNFGFLILVMGLGGVFLGGIFLLVGLLFGRDKGKV